MIDLLKAFLTGGFLCLIGQILVCYVVAGVVLSGIGMYEKLIDFAGAGASVPLTGFGHLLASGVRKAVDEQGFLGIFIGGLKSTAGGITAAILCGLTASLLFKPKDKA